MVLTFGDRAKIGAILGNIWANATPSSCQSGFLGAGTMEKHEEGRDGLGDGGEDNDGGADVQEFKRGGIGRCDGDFS